MKITTYYALLTISWITPTASFKKMDDDIKFICITGVYILQNTMVVGGGGWQTNYNFGAPPSLLPASNMNEILLALPLRW